jgi:hypothetical protein
MGFVGLLETGMGCDLADRLMIAVEAGGIEGAGDQRCIDDHATPAAGGFVHVDNPDGTVVVHIDVVGDGTFNPLLELRQQYDKWRAMNPCPGSSGDTFSPSSSPSASPVATPPMTSGARNKSVTLWRMFLVWVSLLVLA